MSLSFMPRSGQRSLRLLACYLAALTPAAHAQVRLGSPFGDHMVLQSGVPVSIWGDGCPGGDTLKLSIDGQSVITRSDWQGRWLVRLAPMKPGGPFQMLIQIGGSGPLISSSAANDHGGAEINDVMIGKVLLMQESTQASAGVVPRALSGAATKSPPASDHPFAEVRIYRLGDSVNTTYSAHSAAHWVYVAQDVLPPSTAAYFAAGQALHEKLHVPVGVIVVAKGPSCSPPQGCTSAVQQISASP